MDLLNCPECGKKPIITEIFGDYFIFVEDAEPTCFCTLHESHFSDSHYPFFGNEEDCAKCWNEDVQQCLSVMDRKP